MSDDRAHLLQALELTTEQIGRLVDACWTLIHANHKGEKLPDETLALYAEQLRTLSPAH